MTTTRTLTLAATAGALALTLTACAATSSPAPTAAAPAGASAAPAAATQPAPTPTETPTPAPAPTPTTPTVGPYDQFVGGTLYIGTERAPVRIGTDTPGRPPAAEAGFVAAEGWKEYVAASNKYAVGVAESPGQGWFAKIHGMTRFGTVREVGDNGYTQGIYFPTREAAAAGPFMVDGRVLDRSEYILHVN